MIKRRRPLRGVLAMVAVGLVGAACEVMPPDDGNGNGGPPPGPVYNNTTDRTNAGASYIGAEACRACHPGFGEAHSIHGHAQALSPIQGQPPEYPPEGSEAGVPSPPQGVEWSDVAYVIGGYTKKANFVDLDGFVFTSGTNGVSTQWNLASTASGAAEGFVPYDSDGQNDVAYDHSCFRCHVTGAEPFDEDAPRFQDNRPGIAGTWQEAGVQCEACHGPGSNHVPNPQARDLFVDRSAASCGECHSRSTGQSDSGLLAADGFIRNYQQYDELLASGAHSGFRCGTCHDAHASVLQDRENSLTNECQDCHQDQTFALHAGKTFVRGDYVEEMNCESCHMPFATRSASSASAAVVGSLGRMADSRTHIFRIDTRPVTYLDMFSSDLSEVRRDDAGRAAVTVDFVCLRCHNGVGNAFELTVSSAAAIATDMHSAGQ